MKLNHSILKSIGFALLAGFVLFAFETEAQTTRRAKPKKSPLIVSPPPPPQGTPEIISRADQYLDGNQIVEPETIPVETAPVESAPENADDSQSRIRELNQRILNLETDRKSEYDEKQKRLLLNLDILTRAEQRAETLRKQMFDMIERESQIRTKLDQIANDSRPEMIERQAAFSGSLRPEEIRDARRKNLESEKRNLENLLSQIESTKSSLEQNLQKADLLVQKLRDKLEKEIDDALVENPQN